LDYRYWQFFYWQDAQVLPAPLVRPVRLVHKVRRVLLDLLALPVLPAHKVRQVLLAKPSR
jgi:hypothetical protein